MMYEHLQESKAEIGVLIFLFSGGRSLYIKQYTSFI